MADQNNKKTHWRNCFKNDYLASWDLSGPVILTIEKCVYEEAKLQKKEMKPILHFVEKELDNGLKIKPMIMNPTNSKKIHTDSRLFNIEDWSGLKIEISPVANNSRIGGDQKLSITKVFSSVSSDISPILESKDVEFVKTEANKILKQMSPAQKKQVRDHIAKLEKNV